MDEQRIRELREECEDGLRRCEVASLAKPCAELRALCDLALEALASRGVVRAAEELRAECANPAPDATMRRHLRNRLFAALDAREGKP